MPTAVAGAAGTVLLIAYHFPPIRGSSGVQRTLRFAQHLPKFGWRPIVLSITPFAYPDTSPTAAGNELPADLEVHRAFGLDTGRHLSLFGRYPRALALPDRWATWRLWGVRAAMRIIRERNVSAIWSTFPIATAHLIGLEVARRSGLPWIAEFRDPMWQGDYPPDPRVNRAWKQLETEIFDKASRVMVVTPSAATVYRDRFGSVDPGRIVVIENGYDEETFARAEGALASSAKPSASDRRPLTLLHSGLVYPSERDPTQLFAALAALKSRGALSANDVRIVFRASGNDRQYQRELEALQLTDIVHLEPAVSYLAALQELLTVDGLLLLQAANCNAQIPAKLYEYLRAGRPILTLTDPQGDTAATLRAAGSNVIARLDSQQEIEAILPKFLDAIRNGNWPRPSAAAVASYSRQSQTGELARLLGEIAQPARR
jgi:glycosyltransferase involved in cell wall biosynthesis